MASLIMAQLVLMGMLLMSFLPKYTIAQLRPMCISQFALANQACAVLKFTDAPSDRNNTNRIQVASDNDDDDDDDDNDDDDDDNDNDADNDDDDPDEPEHDNRQRNRNGNRTRRGNRNSNGQRQGNRNGNGQRHKNGNGNRQSHGHGHGNGHGSRHGHGGRHGDNPRVFRDCCRWLDEVDESCVCTALLHLPPFLVKPKHRYFIKVGDTCDRTFDCHGA